MESNSLDGIVIMANENNVRIFLYLCGLNLVLLIVIIFLMIRKFKLKNPEKSYQLAIIDTLMYPFRLLKIGPFKYGEWTLQKAMQHASDVTKLTDYGDLSFVQNYKVVHDSVTFRKIKMTNLGRFMYFSEFDLFFQRRLRMIDYFKAHPEIFKIPIKSPVFVFGLGRSGTTFTHHLLSLDPQVRSPRLWELINPVPNFTAKDLSTEQAAAMHQVDRSGRKEYIRKRLDTRSYLGQDGMEHIHSIGYDEPEEDLMVMCDVIPCGFNHLFSSLVDWEPFLKQCQGEEMKKAYRYYKQFLQLLMYQVSVDEQDKRWVLKTPIHVMFLPELLAIFPDAKLVWAHRHPLPTVTSLCTLLKAIHGLYFEKDTIDLNYMGKKMILCGNKVLDEVPKFLKKNKVPCAHVLYQELVKSPVDTVRNVYKQFGWEITAEYETILHEYVQESKAKRAKIAAKRGKDASHPLNLYHPKEYGLEAEQLTSGIYQAYAEEFKITSTD